jgi:hypothetical protein
MLLAKLRASGLRVAADGDALVVEPRAALNEETRAIIRMHKRAILQELERERAEHGGTIAKAIEAARLVDYRAALLLGRLHLCGNCAHFKFGAGPAGPGACAVFVEELLPFAMPFYCAKFQVSATPAAPSFLPDEDGTMAIERELAKPVLPANLPFNDPIPDLVGGAWL